MNPIVRLTQEQIEQMRKEFHQWETEDNHLDVLCDMALRAIPAAINEHTRQLCIQACERVAKRIPHGANDCIAAIKEIPQSEIDGAGEAVATDVAWLHKFINCVPFGEHCPAEDMTRAHEIVNALAAPAALPEGYVLKSKMVSTPACPHVSWPYVEREAWKVGYQAALLDAAQGAPK